MSQDVPLTGSRKRIVGEWGLEDIIYQFANRLESVNDGARGVGKRSAYPAPMRPLHVM